MNTLYLAISQIKRNNLTAKSIRYDFIETMYKSGREFDFDFSSITGTYRGKLQILEIETKKNYNEMETHKDNINKLKTQIDNMSRELKDDNQKMRSELTVNVNNLEEKFNSELNKQKTKNLQLHQMIDDIKKDTINVRNLYIELKRRMEDLQLRVGTK